MTSFNRAFEILASDAFVSSFDDPDDAPEPPTPDAWSDPRTLRSHTRVPGLDFYTDRKRNCVLWRVRWPNGDGTYTTAARSSVDRALEVWAAHYGDTERARDTLKARGCCEVVRRLRQAHEPGHNRTRRRRRALPDLRSGSQPTALAAAPC